MAPPNPDLDSYQKEFEQKTGAVNLLFLDLSSSCTGFCVASVDFSAKKAVFNKAGAIWFKDTWDNQEKYYYVHQAIVNYFNIVDQIDFCVCEAYMLNPKKRTGAMVSCELHGAVQVALAEIGVKYANILPQVWRKHTGIKKNAEGDYKKPTKEFVEKLVKLPEVIVSNISKAERQIPNDLTDAIAIAIGTLDKFGIKKLDFSKIEFQSDVSILN